MDHSPREHGDGPAIPRTFIPAQRTGPSGSGGAADRPLPPDTGDGENES